MKLIAILRNPVNRAYSHYNHMVRVGREKLSFDDALEMEDERLFQEEEKIQIGPRVFNIQASYTIPIRRAEDMLNR